MTTVGTLQAESMRSTVGFGAHIVTDASASGGKALLVDSAVTVKGTVTLSAPASKLTLRARTDGTAANVVVAVDDMPFYANHVPAKTWASYGYDCQLAAGAHTVTIRFLNPEARNLFLDSIVFTGAPVTPPITIETHLSAYLTGYGYPDNDPANSDAIAYPTTARPHAGGRGTYADPITMAVGYTTSGSGGTVATDWPRSTIFYVPTLRRYFRVEDLCGACHSSPRPVSTSTWLDCWVGGKGRTAAYVDAVSAKLTGSHIVIANPASNYVVMPGEISLTGVTLYGETAVKAQPR